MSVYEDLSSKYEDKANLADQEGFYRLATEMRILLASYKNDAERMRNHYYDEY